MAARGDVLALRRAVSFLPGARLERYVVLQSDDLSHTLDTVVVAPIDRFIAAYAAVPGLVRLSSAEVGAQGEHAGIIFQLQSLPLERFEPSRVGRARPATLRRIEDLLRILFDLA